MLDVRIKRFTEKMKQAPLPSNMLTAVNEAEAKFQAMLTEI
jgi:hypothetical protein